MTYPTSTSPRKGKIAILQIEIDSPALEKEINALIDAGLYADLTVLMTDALEKLVTTKRESRLDAAILLYQHGEVTLARAAELADVHRFEFDAALNAKGISKTVEVESVNADKNSWTGR